MNHDASPGFRLRHDSQSSSETKTRFKQSLFPICGTGIYMLLELQE